MTEFDERSRHAGTNHDAAGRIGARIGDLLDRVPGYRGYRSKEDRRDADRRIRDHLSLELEQRVQRVEQIAGDLANPRRIHDIGPVDQLARTMRHLIDRVRTATYGYGGLFGDRDVDEAALDQIAAFDESMLSRLGELDTAIGSLESAHAAGGDVATPVNAAATQVQILLARFDTRARIVDSAEPLAPEKIDEILNPQPQPALPSAWNLDAGSAVSILGQNHLVDARIDVDDGERSFRVFRLGGQSWLWVPRVSDQSYALLNENDAANDSPDSRWAATAEGKGIGQAIGTSRATARRPVSYRLMTGTDDATRRAITLDWGSSRQVFIGHDVHPDDVELFGKPGGKPR